MKTAAARGAGMTLKFAVLIIGLVVMIVAGVSVPLLLGLIPRERRMLATGLQKRANILLESVAARAAGPVRSGESGYPEAGSLARERATMADEALGLVISGPGDPARAAAPDREDPLDRDYLWAAQFRDDPEAVVAPAQSPVDDVRLPPAKVREIAASVNAAAAAALQEVVPGAGGDDQRSRIEGLLRAVAADPRHAGVEPAFDPDNLADTYLFFRPLVFAAEDGQYFSGMVRLEVTTAVVQAEVTRAVNGLSLTAGLIALAALAIGIAGAFLLASIAIRPIGKLVRFVAEISAAEDKESTKDLTITVRARDEVGTLTENVKQMRDGLVTAAIADKMMLAGREVQKQFLPLERLAGGDKGSTAGIRTGSIDLYAYYEGAATMSGDYFDWQQLDARYYAVIKCDVSGHGVEAAFIMVEVATLFLRWCREWKERLSAPATARDALYARLRKLETFAYTVNDMIEQRGFKGKFAAFMVSLYDLDTGTVTACSAGDNVIHRYDARSVSLASRDLDPAPPAAGSLPSDMIQASKNPYRTETFALGTGDVFVLFTDGYEDSRRYFRDAAGRKVPVEAGDPGGAGQRPESRPVDYQHESFSVPRILGVFDAFFKKAVYHLERNHLAAPETMEFDFGTCGDTLEEAVLALVAVERVYRTYRVPSTTEKNRIELEPKVDAYLRRHFRQYRAWFGDQAEPDPAASKVIIANIEEDTQVDDLTIVLLRRP